MLADQPASNTSLNLRWTVSNALSVLRLILAVPAALAVESGMRWQAIALFVAAAVTDVLDGYIARRYHEISDLGKILDPLADKVFVGAVVVVMLIQGALPVWFVAAVLGRDALILAGGVYVERRTGVVLPSNYPGKIAVLVLSATLLLIVAGVPPLITDSMMWATLLLLAVSFTLYTMRAVTTAHTQAISNG